MRKDLTRHLGPDGHLHVPIIKLKKDKQNKHAKFMVTVATWQTATLFSSLLIYVFKEGASTTV